MRELVEYIVKPLTKHPDDVQVTQIDGNASVILELRVHPDDLARVRGEDGAPFRAIQQVLSAAGGARKPILDLIESGRGARQSEDEE
ncbi:MAG: KH domain-containing protein [Myxococcota bacterium]